MSFAWQAHQAWYVPFPENYQETLEIVSEFKGVLENKTIEKTGQNLKFDISILRWYDIHVKGPLFDTMLAHYLIQPDMRHGMDYLAETYLNYKPVPIETLIGKKGQQQLSMRTVDTETLKEYAAEDADITWQLKKVFTPLLAETETRELFDTIEVPLIDRAQVHPFFLHCLLSPWKNRRAFYGIFRAGLYQTLLSAKCTAYLN